MKAAVDREALLENLRDQARYCRALGSPFTAQVLDLLGDDLVAGGPVTDVLVDYALPPRASAVALRLAGALHALVLTGRDAALASRYPPHPEAGSRGLLAALRGAIRREPGHFRDFLLRAVQTNEVQRSAVLLPGWLTAARRTALPLRVLEIGASGGLNLLADRYHYEFGDAAWGPDDAAVRFAPDWQGAPPPVDVELAVISRRGVDIDPLDLRDDAVLERGLAYIWPDQPERLARFRAAADELRASELVVEAGDAAPWLEAQLAQAHPGACTLVQHSIMWQYMPRPTRARAEAAIRAAGDRATPEAPLAWLRFEPLGEVEGFELTLDLWPQGGGRQRLAEPHPHGARVRWLG